MITVSILINGHPIYTRTAVNRGKTKLGVNAGKHQYEVDDGSILYHDRSDGAVKLAIAMLGTIREPALVD